jgi:hypothetical protein
MCQQQTYDPFQKGNFPPHLRKVRRTKTLEGRRGDGTSLLMKHSSDLDT